MIRPSILAFGSQTTWPTPIYLSQLRSKLLLEPRLRGFVAAIKELPQVWCDLVDHGPDLAVVPGQTALDELVGWLNHGEFKTTKSVPPNVLSMPMTIILHIAQYFHYLDLLQCRHAQVLEHVKIGGVQGFCTGLLTAIAVASASDEEDVNRQSAVALRLAVCIGAYVDLDGSPMDGLEGTASIIAVRWRSRDGHNKVLESIKSYPDAYISAILDSTDVAITCPTSSVTALTQQLSLQGISVKATGLEGRYHSHLHLANMAAILRFCDFRHDMKFPSADQLQVPLRSNLTAQVLSEGSLQEIAVRGIMVELANWHLTISAAVSQLIHVGTPVAAAFGLLDFVPSSVIRESGIKIEKMRSSNLSTGSLTVPDSTPSSGLGTPAISAPQDDRYPDHAIAVVGMACKFPGADSVGEFWELLTAGTSMVEEMPDARFLARDLRRSPDGKLKFWGNFVRDIDAFDHRFFKKSSREAATMDPQQRLLLEVAYQAMESSGYFDQSMIAARPLDDIGCYLGACANDYNDNVASHPPNAFSSLGTLRAFLSGKISHYFGWTGPSVTYDTACSSSAVAIHSACKAIVTGECSQALAGGVSLYTNPNFYQNLAAASFLSPTGPCKPFDAKADGYCRGEGAGLVVLKKLTAAVACNDHILGVVAGSAVNQNSNATPITVPHSPSQVSLYKKISSLAGIEPQNVSFVEAHGTGTPVGDPIEFASVREVFAGPRRTKPLHVASVKGNIGHLEGASGVAALIKTLLMMQHNTIPVQANFANLNAKIPPLEVDRMSVPVSTRPWDTDFQISCINNYGAAGSNAAMIVCEAPRTIPAICGPGYGFPSKSRVPFLLTAHSDESLQAYCEALQRMIWSNSFPNESLSSLAFNIAHKTNRSFSRSIVATASNLAEFSSQLEAVRSANLKPQTTPKAKPLVLCFGGQVSQAVGLSRDVYDSSLLLRSHLDSCDSILRSMGLGGIYPEIFQSHALEGAVKLHCLLFAMQFSCAMSWLEAGLYVDAVIGHSFGQLTALCVSGVLSLKDGLKLVSGRARLMSERWGPERGSMIAVEADLTTVLNQISSLSSAGAVPMIEIACYNGPTSHVLVGTRSAVEVLRLKLVNASIRHKILNVTHGFHSVFTDPLLPGLAELAGELDFSQPSIPLETCTEDRSWGEIGARQITDHTRMPVFFGQAVQRLARSLGPATWLEAGSGSSITTMASRAFVSSTNSSHTFQAMNLSEGHAMDSLADATANLWRSGHRTHFWPHHRSQRQLYQPINLPPYQFEKSRHWLSWVDSTQVSTPVEVSKPDAEIEHVLLSLTGGQNQSDGDALFTVDPQSKEYSFYVQGHAVLAEPLCPAPLYVELASRAAIVLLAESSTVAYLPSVHDLEISAPLGMDLDRAIRIKFRKAKEESASWIFELSSQSRSNTNMAPSTHATGRVSLHLQGPKLQAEFSRYERLIGYGRFDSLRLDAQSEILQGASVYKAFSRVVKYADHYKGVRSVHGKGQQIVGLVNLPDCDQSAFQDSITKPLAVDNFVQVAGLHVNCLNDTKDSEVYVCTKVERIQLGPTYRGSTSWVVHSSFTVIGEREISNDIFVFDLESKKLVLMVLGAHFTRVLISSLTKVLSRANPMKTHTATSKQEILPDPTVLTKSLDFVPEKGLVAPANSPSVQSRPKSSSSGQGSSTIDKEIRELLHEVTDVPVEDFKDDSTLEDLGVDSLMITEVMSEVCQHFKLDISASDFATLLDVKALRNYLLARGCGGSETGLTPEYTSESGEESDSATPASSAGTSVEDMTVPEGDIQSDLAKLVASHLETDIEMTRETNLANEGLDSLLCIELAADIKKDFGATVDMSLLDGNSSFGDLLDMVTLQCRPSVTMGKGKISSPVSAPTPVIKISSNGPLIPAEQHPASMDCAQQAFEDIRFDYDVFARKTSFADFWKRVYPTQAKLVLAYTVEAFATLGCRLASMNVGQRLPRVQFNPKHNLLVDQLHEILKEASLVRSDGTHLVRSDQPVDETPSTTLLHRITQEFPHHASEHQLLNITGSRLAECLTGAADPLQLLFRRKEDKELLEDVYTNGPMYEAITRLLGSFLQKAFSTSRNGDIFHILELGGGTGGTTKYLVDFLSSQNVQFAYTFTDISGSLVTAAKKKFAGRTCMDFKVLDIEKQPPEAFLTKFHTIISTNCIHATRNLQASTANIRQMLRPDGFVSLVEFTRNMFWFDLVFGLLEGWWLFEDGRNHVLADTSFWDRSMRAAGFEHVTWTDGHSEEARTLRIITGFPAKATDKSFRPKKFLPRPRVETLMYRQAGKTALYADVYVPPNITPSVKRPIALLIHGGGHVMFTRKEVNLKQIRLLFDGGFLPVSCDYRFCPELNIIDGPMNDTCEALRWARSELPLRATDIAPGLQADGDKVVAVGWSTGGHLAMTLAFTAPQWGLRPPQAILALYCPSDYEDEWWSSPIYPEASISSPQEPYDLLEGIQKEPIASYYPSTNTNHPAMLMSLADPRWRFVLHMNWRAQTLPFLINGPTSTPTPTSPSPSQIKSISPYAQILSGAYKTPTFLIHGRPDDLIPWQQSARTVEALRERGVSAGLEVVEGARHLFDTFPEEGVVFEGSVGTGYAWLRGFV